MKTSFKNQLDKVITFTHIETTTITKVGFNEQGKPCYTEGKEKGIRTFRGMKHINKAVHFATPLDLSTL